MNTAAAITASRDYERIAAAIRFLQANWREQPRLETLARHAGVSPFHLQRIFQRWAGISPKRLLEILTLEHTKPQLNGASPVLEASLAGGLSGPGRLHDLFVTLEAVTPGEYRRGGAGVEIRHGFQPSPFGRVLVAVTPRGVCGLAFCEPEPDAAAIAEMRGHWPRADWRRDDRAVAPVVRRIFSDVRAGEPLAVVVRGTNFQVRVWQALLRIPEGARTTYTAVAAEAGRPAAVRAAASAIGDNPVSWLIPCHRVLRQTGALGGYRWGLERKAAMLAWEAARAAV